MMKRLFPTADPNCVIEGEENQTYESFVDIGKRKPNMLGTGRFKLTKDRNKVLVVYFGSKEKIPLYLSDFLYLSASITLEVQHEEQLNALNIVAKTMMLDGVSYDSTTSKQPKKKHANLKLPLWTCSHYLMFSFIKQRNHFSQLWVCSTLN
jgi:hypothetical protein